MFFLDQNVDVPEARGCAKAVDILVDPMLCPTA